MKRMLFNATQAEELRVAIVDGQKLIDLDIETVGKEQRKSNIYKGVITRIEPSLEAAFVDYGCERHGFLPFKEIARAYFQPTEGAEGGRFRIQDVLREGMELIVQVDKDERGNKGAALTTFISLAGRYLVLMPNNPRGGGVSRRIEGEERNELREIMSQLEVPSGMSIIARTAGIGRSLEELQWDLNYLLQLWNAIEDASKANKAPILIYQESSLVIRAIRDYFQPDIGEILIDTEYIYDQAYQFMSYVMPANANRVKIYKDDIPLFSRFQIEHQIETAYSRQVPLPSGGAIVIDHTEALVSIDVNSARATKGSDIEETATRTNLEAADEIARQLRLRDLGGLIVIDFIDMESAKNQREVENRLKDALHHDRARVQLGKLSRFGLLELSRQRLQPSLGETSHTPCPRCHGIGFIRSTESSALHILRILQEEAMKEHTAAIQVQVPVDVATFLLNEKRREIYAIEARLKVHVYLIPNTHLETPNYHVLRLRHDDAQIDDGRPSYQMVEVPEDELSATPANQQKAKNEKPRQEAVVKGITPAQPAPIVPERKSASAGAKKPGLIDRIIGWFKGVEAEPEKPAPRGRRNHNGPKPRREGNRPPRQERRRDEETPRSEKPARNEKPAKTERTERAPREEQVKAVENQQPAREPRQPRERRQPRQPREAAPVVDALEKPQLPEGVEASPVETAETPRRNSRNRNRNRNRREGQEQDVTSAAVASEAIEATPAPVAEAATPAPFAAAPVAEAISTPVAAPVEAVVPAEPAPVVVVAPAAAPVVAAEPVEVAVPATEEAAPVEAVAPQATQLSIELEPSSDLVLVKTRADIAIEPAVSNEEAPAKPRTRRPRRSKAESVETEPLQLVETVSQQVQTVAEAPVAEAPAVEASEQAAETPRPRRRRRSSAASAAESEPLQLVETKPLTE